MPPLPPPPLLLVLPLYNQVAVAVTCLTRLCGLSSAPFTTTSAIPCTQELLAVLAASAGEAGQLPGSPPSKVEAGSQHSSCRTVHSRQSGSAPGLPDWIRMTERRESLGERGPGVAGPPSPLALLRRLLARALPVPPLLKRPTPSAKLCRAPPLLLRRCEGGLLEGPALPVRRWVGNIQRLLLLRETTPTPSSPAVAAVA